LIPLQRQLTTPTTTTIEEGAVTAPVETPKEDQEQKIEEEKVEEAAPELTTPAPKELLSIEAISEQLRAVNSKERRKLLRALAVDYDADFLNKATEASKQVVIVPVVDAAPVAVDVAPAADVAPVDEKVQEVANA